MAEIIDTRWKNVKYIPIRYKVFTEENILQLAKIVENLKTNDNDKTVFSVIFDGIGNVSSSSMTIFSDDDFKRRNSNRIKMDYYSENQENNLFIHLYGTVISQKRSVIKISSLDNTWYEALLNQLQTYVDNVKPQRKITALNNKNLVKNLPIILSVIYVFVLLFSFRKLLIFGKIGSIFLELLSAISFAKIAMGLAKAFPEVEFAFGSNYKDRGKNLIKTILWALGLIIPLILMIIFLR